MQAKKFVAPTLRQALDALRAELGSDALILSTSSGVDPTGAPYVEVIGVAHSQPSTSPSPAKPPALSVGQHPRSSDEPIPLRYYLEQRNPREDAIAALQEEIHRLSAKLTEVKHAVAYRYSSILPDPLRRMYHALRDAGFAEQYAGFLIAQICKDGYPARLEHCVEALREVLAQLLPLEPPLQLETPPPIIAVAGPSGSGKTTTLMKAAVMLQKAGVPLSLRLLSADTERIAANEQLKAFAAILSLPFELVRSPEELQPDRSALLLLDTPPPTKRNATFRQALLSRVAEAGGVIIVTIPATMEAELARSLLEPAMNNRAYRVALTKVDEANLVGHVLPVLWECNMPLSLVATGTRLSEDLVEPSIDHLLRLLLPGYSLVSSIV